MSVRGPWRAEVNRHTELTYAEDSEEMRHTREREAKQVQKDGQGEERGREQREQGPGITALG